MKRRTFLKSAAGLALAAPFARLAAGSTAGAAQLVAVPDLTTGLPLVKLPPGFSYRSFDWTGDVVDGFVIPDRHDAMATFMGTTPGETILVRNHERVLGAPISAPDLPVYDAFQSPADPANNERGFPGFAGGVTAVTFVNGEQRGTRPLIGGTLANCAGGPTPWGTWITCEELMVRGSRFGAKDHGYAFEVSLTGGGDAQPITDMGWMRHEAAVVDPETGFVYMTEDNAEMSGFYRFTPSDGSKKLGSLAAGGRLEMLRVRGRVTKLLTPQTGDSYNVTWVRVRRPDEKPESFVPLYEGGPSVLGSGRSGPFMQGEAAGGTTFNRGEGCWYHDGAIYWADTAGGRAQAGAIWAYDPKQEKLTAVYVSPSQNEASKIDNITLAANGTIVACEDNGGFRDEAGTLLSGTRLLAIRGGGPAQPIIENVCRLTEAIPGKPAIAVDDYRGAEWTGVCFSPDGGTLFVNLQTPGLTLAITGPWDTLLA